MICKFFVKHTSLFILGAGFFVYIIDVFLKAWVLRPRFKKKIEKKQNKKTLQLKKGYFSPTLFRMSVFTK